MQTATSNMESKSLDLSICVHLCTLSAHSPTGQGTVLTTVKDTAVFPVLPDAVNVKRGDQLFFSPIYSAGKSRSTNAQFTKNPS